MFGRPKESTPIQKDVKSKEDTSSDSEDKMAINKNLAFNKRKSDLLLDGGEVVEKKKKGRPRKDKMPAPVSQPLTLVGQEVFTCIYSLVCFKGEVLSDLVNDAFVCVTLEYDCKALDKDESVSMPVCFS